MNKSFCCFVLDEDATLFINSLLGKKDSKFIESHKNNTQNTLMNNPATTSWNYVGKLHVDKKEFFSFDITHEISKNEQIRVFEPQRPNEIDSNVYDMYYARKFGQVYFTQIEKTGLVFMNVNHHTGSHALRRTVGQRCNKIPVNFSRILELAEDTERVDCIKGFWAASKADRINTISAFGSDIGDTDMLKKHKDKLKNIYFNYKSRNGQEYKFLMLSKNGVISVTQDLSNQDMLKLFLEVIQEGLFKL